MTQSSNGQVAVKLEDIYRDKPTEVTSPVTNLTGTRLGGDLCLGVPRPGKDPSPGIGPRLDGDLSLGGGPRPGRN